MRTVVLSNNRATPRIPFVDVRGFFEARQCKGLEHLPTFFASLLGFFRPTSGIGECGAGLAAGSVYMARQVAVVVPPEADDPSTALLTTCSRTLFPSAKKPA